MNLIHQSFKILHPTDDIDAKFEMQQCERAGRICYNSLDKIGYESYDKFIRSRIKQGHETPLEFGRMTVEVVTSRDVLAELTRHRLASFCVQSQRYCNYTTNGVSFIIPLWFVEGEPHPQSAIWIDSMDAAERDYIRLIHEGMPPQDARLVLPNSTACTLMLSANFREWRHIFKLRTDSAAYPMMRQLMNNILKEAVKMMPCVFEDLLKGDEL